MIEPVNDKRLTRIGVFGTGGAGCNAINHMIDARLTDVEFYAVNTDLQALAMSSSANKIQIGAQLTGGLGSGGDPVIGRQAAEESVEAVRENITGLDMVFLAAGMGGGTGTGATPIIAEIAREQGALVVAVVTRPFDFEGRTRARKATDGIQALRAQVDTLIVLPNQRVLEVYGKEPCFEAFRMADEVLLNAVRGIADIVTSRQLINIDFADVRSVMAERGGAVMAVGFAEGEGRAEEAAHLALASPLIENVSVETARKVLLNISGDESMTLAEVSTAAQIINHATNGQADIRMGAARPRDLKSGMKITLIATGLNEPLPTLDEVSDLLRDPSLFQSECGAVGGGRVMLNRNDLNIPAFLRRGMD